MVFQKSFEYRIKRYNGSRAWWWEQTPYAGGAVSFCIVQSVGSASSTGAGDATGGISPAFCIA
jgi:hypothetical protein